MRRLAILMILFCSCAYGFEVKPVGEKFLRWDTVSSVTMVMSATIPGYLSPAGVDQTMNETARMWSNVPGQSFRCSYKGRGIAIANSADFQNSVVWIFNHWQYSSSVISVTSYSYYMDNPNTIVDADILLNAEHFRWTIAPAPPAGEVSLRNTLLHELGHVAGLSHSSVLSAAMFPYVRYGSNQLLNLDERSGLQFLYGGVPDTLKNITPVQNARYVAAMSSRGLPLPVFRWGRGGYSNFTLEFSATPGFAKKWTIQVGMNNFHQLSDQQEKKLMSLTAADTIYWRVRTSTSVTPSRRLLLKR